MSAGISFRTRAPPGTGKTFDWSTTLANPLSDKGKYTAVFRPGAAPNNGVAATGFPQGHGWAALTVAATGKVTIVGKLADGTPFGYGNALSKTNELPVHVLLYGAKGFLGGPVKFDPTETTSDASGPGIKWFKPARPSDTLYRNGWPGGINAAFIASKLVLPAKATLANPTPLHLLGRDNILGLAGAPTPANVEFHVVAGGTPGYSNDAVVNANSTVAIGGATAGASGATGLTATLSASTGMLTGSLKHPGNNNVAIFSGMVLQKTHTAGAYFLYFPPTPAGQPVPPGVSGDVFILPKP